jgi:ATP-binding protein involved in chromosome partitioning
MRFGRAWACEKRQNQKPKIKRQKSKMNEQAVMQALGGVKDPELGKDLVTLKMIKDVSVQGGRVSLTVVLTTPACPLKGAIENDVRAALVAAGAKEVAIQWSASVPGARGVEGKAAIPGVKNMIAVASGKGGVGKTTVAVNLALALSRMGCAVGLLDADVYGPNVPLMLGVFQQPRASGENRIEPVQGYGIKVMSMGFLNPGDKPLIWRGPMLHSVIQQFLRNVTWGDLDYLVIDLPPGTGDVQLTLIQTVPLAGAVIVTTPSDVSLEDARKAVTMFQQVKVDILGIVENMSYFVCGHCGTHADIFSRGGGARMAAQFGVPFLGEIPIEPEVRAGGDTGSPVATRGPDSPQAKPFFTIAQQVAARLSVINLSEDQGPLVTIRD